MIDPNRTLSLDFSDDRIVIVGERIPRRSHRDVKSGSGLAALSAEIKGSIEAADLNAPCHPCPTRIAR